jgi:hypothetical protein
MAYLFYIVRQYYRNGGFFGNFALVWRMVCGCQFSVSDIGLIEQWFVQSAENLLEQFRGNTGRKGSFEVRMVGSWFLVSGCCVFQSFQIANTIQSGPRRENDAGVLSIKKVADSSQG